MCPGFLWFTFIQRPLVTHDSCSYTVSGYTTLQSKSRPQFFQQSTTLHSLLFLFVNVKWIMQLFFFSHLLIFLTCGFILLSVALFVQWHIKKERCFFYVKEQKVVFFFSMCKIKGRMSKYKTSRKKNMLYFLPCQSDMQNLINFQRFF